MTKDRKFCDDFDFANLPFLCAESHSTKPMEIGDPNDPTRPYIRVTGGDYGLASKEDGKVLNALRSEITNRKISGCKITLSADALLSSAGFTTSLEGLERLKEALQRLISTAIFTTVDEGSDCCLTGSRYLDSYYIIFDNEIEDTRHVIVEIKLAQWLYKVCLDPKRFIDVDPAYYFSTPNGLT